MQRGVAVDAKHPGLRISEVCEEPLLFRYYILSTFFNSIHKLILFHKETFLT